MSDDLAAREEEACAIIEASERRQHFTDVRHVTVRWEPYKKDGQRQMKAKGRWQEQVGSGDYWRWQNCNRPAFAHDPQPADRVEALEAELQGARAEARKAIADAYRMGRDTQSAAIDAALAELEASLFTNAEHQRAMGKLRAAREATK